MDTDAQQQMVLRSVPDVEGLRADQQLQRHAADLGGVRVAVLLRQAGHHHVGIADGLHLDSGMRHGTEHREGLAVIDREGLAYR